MRCAELVSLVYWGVMHKILIPLLALLLVLVLIAFYAYGNLEAPYYAVYLSSGDLYFGKLHRFPRLSLTDAWFLERSTEQGNALRIANFREAFWQPQGTLFLSEKNILWLAPLSPDSRVIQYMKNPASGELPPAQVLPALPLAPGR